MRVLQAVPASLCRARPFQIIPGQTPDDSFHLIFPGTMWCGPGALTEDSNQLGALETTDRCCRDHDFCPDFIEPGQSKYGLTNSAAHYKLHCDCDKKFLLCLEADSTQLSHLMRILYFEVIHTQCFREDYPIIKCTSFKDKMSHRCQTYELDTTAPTKLYQFFDVSSLLS